MGIEIHKEKLPAGMSYALRPSQLEDLVSAYVSVPTSLHQWRGRELWGERRLLDATFYPPGRYYLNDDEVLHVGSYAVPSAQRQHAIHQLQETVLPEFIRWIVAILAEPDGSTVRRETQRFIRMFEKSEETERPLSTHSAATRGVATFDPFLPLAQCLLGAVADTRLR